MAKFQKSIQISTPVEKVFDYLLNPDNLLEIWPNLVDVKVIKHTSNGELSSYNWNYKIAGMTPGTLQKSLGEDQTGESP
jgi:ligand-binding SRPBCC domain-containing protein